MHRILELQSFRPGRYRSNSRRIFQKICWASTHSQHSPCLPLMIFRYIRQPLRPLLRDTSDSYIHDLLLCVTLWEPWLQVSTLRRRTKGVRRPSQIVLIGFPSTLLPSQAIEYAYLILLPKGVLDKTLEPFSRKRNIIPYANELDNP